MKNNSTYRKEINLGLEELDVCKKIHHYYSFALDDLNDEKNLKKEKIKLEYIDFEMYKFIF